MDIETASPEAGAPSAVEQHGATPEAPESFTSASEAARYLASVAHAKRKESAAPQAQAEPDAPAEQPVSGDEPNGEPEQAASEEEAPESEAKDESLPPIDPPVSWPKEDKDYFVQLPRQAQEIIARREQERDRHFLKGQNESAEQRKAIEAEKLQAEQVRQQYEAQLPLVAQTLQQALLAEFSDIKNDADVRKMAAEDWPRYIQWDLRTKELARWQNEINQAQVRQQNEAQATLQKWVESQDEEIERSLSSIPEKERTSLAKEAKQALIDYGMKEYDIFRLWNTSILRSAPIQRMMADAARYRIAKRGSVKAAAKPVPPVQKPGNAVRAPNRALETQIAALEAKPSLSLKEATLLVDLQSKRRAAA